MVLVDEVQLHTFQDDKVLFDGWKNILQGAICGQVFQSNGYIDISSPCAITVKLARIDEVVGVPILELIDTSTVHLGTVENSTCSFYALVSPAVWPLFYHFTSLIFFL